MSTILLQTSGGTAAAAPHRAFVVAFAIVEGLALLGAGAGASVSSGGP